MDSHLIGQRSYSSATGLFIAGYHIALAVGLPIYFWNTLPSLGLVLASFALMVATEIGIGAAYHRFYSHRAFTLSRSAEAVLLGLATVAFQGSVLRWAFEHRLHHTYVDTDRDPYSIKKGFWYAHMMWLFEPAQPFEESRVPDLVKNPLVMFQHRYYAFLSVGSNVLIWLAFGWFFSDYLGAFVIAWWTRLLISHHLTWFVNSLAHCWGERTYSKEHSAVDNYILAILTVGEGYHNYHHTFASDYRNGVRWYHVDPVKWTVWTLSKLGLAGNLRRFNTYAIKRRLLLEDYKLFSRKLAEMGHDMRAELERKLQPLAEAMSAKLKRMRALAEEIKTAKARDRAAARARARAELKALAASLREDWESWGRLGDLILDAQPAAA